MNDQHTPANPPETGQHPQKRRSTLRTTLPLIVCTVFCAAGAIWTGHLADNVDPAFLKIGFNVVSVGFVYIIFETVTLAWKTFRNARKTTPR